MKRSRSIRLVLIGGLSAGIGGCGGPTQNQAIAPESVYTNNHYVPGVGYYHAPFRAWYPLPYNHFDPRTQQYFHGGRWTAAPHESITNISNPTGVAAQQAQAQRTDIVRRGFGSTSRSHPIYT